MNQFKFISIFLLVMVFSLSVNAQRKHHYKKVHHNHKTNHKGHHHNHKHLRFVKARPDGGVFMTHQGAKFYMHNGTCYRQKGKQWEVIETGFTVGIKTLPSGHTIVKRGGCTFYKHNNKFYRAVSGGFIVVNF